MTRSFKPYLLLVPVIVLLSALPTTRAQDFIGRFTSVWLNNACIVRTGSGTPEGAVTGNVCDVFLRTNGSTSTTLYVKESGAATNTGWVAVTGGGITASSTDTLTNKTLNVESTGNVVTITEKIDVPVAHCVDGSAWSNWDGGSAPNVAGFSCVGGMSNGFAGYLMFDNTNVQSAYNKIRLPADWTGTIDLDITWFGESGATSGNTRFAIQTKCYAATESLNGAFNSAQEIVDAANGVAATINEASLSTVTTTGCSAGEHFMFAITRDPTHASDTTPGNVGLYTFILTIRRAL